MTYLSYIGLNLFGVKTYLHLNLLWHGGLCITSSLRTKIWVQGVVICLLFAICAAIIRNPLFICFLIVHMQFSYGTSCLGWLVINCVWTLLRIFGKFVTETGHINAKLSSKLVWLINIISTFGMLGTKWDSIRIRFLGPLQSTWSYLLSL
jgi:hypothetical protein